MSATTFTAPVGSDPHCGSCAFRVNERYSAAGTLEIKMVCLHSAVGRQPCGQARGEFGACGPTATLYLRHECAPAQQLQVALL